MITNRKNLLAGIMLLTILATACDQREQATPTVQPPIGSVEVTEDTRQTYQWYCSQCHGTKGKGDGVNARFLTVPPRNHTKAQYLETRTDEQLFEAIKFGGLSVGRAPCMPAWGETINDNSIHSLVQYIRELCQCEAL
jgi:cytochrome c oxidase cbb3-type subunit III